MIDNPPRHSAVTVVEIDAGASGQRLDNYLLTRLKGVPRSLVYRLLRDGQVRVNKGRKKPHYRLCEGDQVRIPPLRQASRPERPALRDDDATALASAVLYEDDALLVLNKPSGMAVHGGSGISYGVIEALRQLYPRQRFLELAHRLDRDTSGCLVVAKKRAALVALQSQIRREAGIHFEKTYQALLRGTWSGPKRRIEAALRRNILKSGERLVTVDPAGKPSTSIFVPLRNFPRAAAALVEIRLVTGRTHQARVHAASISQPIAGDEKYGDREFNQAMRQLGLRRLFLHAARLRFRHPLDDRIVDVSAPLPGDLAALLEQLA